MRETEQVLHCKKHKIIQMVMGAAIHSTICVIIN